MSEVFTVHARIDEPPREHAKTEFTRTARTSRSLIAVVASLLRDGYEVTITAPDGASFSGSEIATLEMMDPDHGYSPRPEFAERVEFRHGTWLLTDPTS